MSTLENTCTDDLALPLGGWHAVPDEDRAPGPAGIGHGKDLIAVRESNAYDLMAFATMIRQVLEPLAGRVPGVNAVLRLTGQDAAVMRNDARGAALRRELNAQPLYQGNRPYGWVFEVEGTVFLFAMTSAFSDATEDLANNFTDDLIEVLDCYRPSALITGPSTRLVRRKHLGERLGRKAGLLGVRIFTKETPEGLDLNSTTGSTNWTLLGLLAEQDLRYTVGRLLTGRIHHVRAGGWLAGEAVLPLGFALDDPVTKRPVVGDADQVRQARLLLELAAKAAAELHLPEAERALGPETILSKLAAAGAKKRSNKKVNRRGTSIAGTALDTVTAPKTTLLNLLSLLRAYGPEGEVVRMQGLPMTGLSRHDVHGHTIYRKNPGDPEEKGAIRFAWRFPKPVDDHGEEVPWAPDDVLAGAAAYYAHLLSERNPGVSTTQTWPLGGLFTADHDGRPYRLVYGSGGYQWKRDGAAVGKFDARLTTIRFVEAVIDKLDALGIDAREVRVAKPTTSSAPPSAEHVALESRRNELQAALDSACAAVREAKEGSRQRAAHQRVAEELEDQLDRLDAQLAATTAADAEPEPDTDTLLVGDLATLLSVLADTAGERVAPEVCTYLRRLVVDGTVDDCWDDGAPWGTFRATLAIPTDRGSLRQVDIAFEVGNTSQGPDRQAFWARRVPRVLEMRMTTEITIEELATRLGAGPSPRHVGRVLHRALRPHFEQHELPVDAASAAATAIIDCPILSTRSVVWALLTGAELPATVEDLDAAETARHIEDLRERYLAPRFDWQAAAWSRGGERLRREVIRWVAANSGADPSAGAPVPALLAACGFETITALASMLWNDERSADGAARVIERTAPWPSGAFVNPATGTRLDSVPDRAKRVRLRACPHCGNRGLHPLTCVEFGADPVLCPACRRHPWDPTLKRPASYLQNFEGPWGRTSTDDRGARDQGARRGTTAGPPTAMPTASRVRRAKPKPPRQRPPRPAQPCQWPGCTRTAPPTVGKGRPRLYCGEDGHTSRAAVTARQQPGSGWSQPDDASRR